MADETAPTDAHTTPPEPLRAGQPLDLSTGKAPSKPPPEPVRLVPMPAPEGAPEVRAGRTLDMSTGKAPAPRRRKPAAASLGPGPVVRKTVDLSTDTPPAEAPAAEAKPAPSKPSPKPKGSNKGRGGRSDNRGQGGRGGPASSATSLADLLDPDTLAKLRGGK